MRPIRLLTPLAMLPLLTAATCGQKPPLYSTYPPVEDVRTEAKPVPGDDVFESDAAAQRYNSSIEAWGERGWAAVGRICRDAVRKGAPYPAGWCPAEPATAPAP